MEYFKAMIKSRVKLLLATTTIAAATTIFSA